MVACLPVALDDIGLKPLCLAPYTPFDVLVLVE